MKNLIGTFILGAGLILSCLAAPVARGDTNLTTLVTFDGGNGGLPWASLILGRDGNYYGTTEQNGIYGRGTVYQMTPEGQLVTLHHFTGANDGANPKAPLVQGPDDGFYGTATDGGTDQPVYFQGNGVVYKITSAGDFMTVAAFDGTNGANPWAGPLVAGPGGKFYGTTYGGSALKGNIFSVSDDGAIDSLFTFHFTDGFSPYGGLVPDGTGAFYGVTSLGGAGIFGTVFKIMTNGVLTTLVNFSGPNGDEPFSALLRGNDGNFYGTTICGGTSKGDPESINQAGFGTIFKLTPEGDFTTLFSFAGTNGSYPYATLIQDAKGNLYGTTASGGGNTNQLFPNNTGYAGYGTIFRLAPDGTLTTLFSFDGTNGAQAFAGLLRGADGKLYGTTIRGGTYDLGTVYRLETPIVSAPPTITLSAPATAACGSTVKIHAQVSDPDGDALTIVWTLNGLAVQTNTVPASQPPKTTSLSFHAGLPSGTNFVVVAATDTTAVSASASMVITVRDTTPPVIHHASVSTNFLWPADDSLVTVNINALVDDSCGPASWKITRILNTDAANRWNQVTEPAWIITGDHSVKLRAERSPQSPGRIYFIVIQAIDRSGNLSRPYILTVFVPKTPPRPVPHPFR